MPDTPATAHAPRLLYLVKQLEAAIRARLDVALRPRCITVTQYTALTVLAQHPDMSSAQLARHAFVTAQAMDGIVRALLDAQLIERHRDPNNRRRLVISLTAAGIDLLDDCRADVDRIESVAFDRLAEAEQAQLGAWLSEGTRALTVDHQDP